MRRKKYTIEEVRKIIKEKGGKCLDKEYKNNKFPMNFQCGKCSHIWKTNFKQIQVQNQWCPKCSGRLNNNIEVVRNLALERGGKCLEQKYKDNKTNMKWQCGKCSHIWKARFDRVKSGTWCPKCSTSRGERAICKSLDRLGIAYEIEKHLVNGKRNMRFDFFIPEKNIAIEFDGIQHFKIDNRYTPDLETLKHRQNMDIYKTKYCIDNNIKLVRIYYLSLNYVDSIIEEILKNDFAIVFSEYNPYKHIIKTITGIGG